MYAVIRTGGKQYRVSPGDRIEIEKIPGEVGQTVDVGDVLLVEKDSQLQVGRPLVKGAKVNFEILGHGKGRKQIVFKKQRRQGKQLKAGHRQEFTSLKVKDIVTEGS